MSMFYMTLVVPCGFQGFIYCNFLMYILFPLCVPVPVPVPDALGICFIWRVFFPPVLLYTRGDSGTTCVLKWPRVGLLSCLVHESIRQKLYPHLKISSYFFIYYYYYYYFFFFTWTSHTTEAAGNSWKGCQEAQDFSIAEKGHMIITWLVVQMLCKGPVLNCIVLGWWGCIVTLSLEILSM